MLNFLAEVCEVNELDQSKYKIIFNFFLNCLVNFKKEKISTLIRKCFIALY